MRIWLVSIILAILVLCGLFGLGSWLLYSPSASEWLLTRVVTAQGGKIGQVEGTIGGSLQLTELELSWPTGQLNCAKIQLKTELLSLFPLQLEITQLQLENLLIDQQPSQQEKKPVLLSWPELPWWLGMIEIDLRQLKLVDFRLSEQQVEQLTIEQLQLHALWRDQSLQLSEFFLRSPDFVVEGQLTTDFDQPALQSDFQIRHLGSESSWQQLIISTDLRGTQELLLNGAITLAVAANEHEQFNIAGELGLMADTLQFHQLRLQRANRSGVLIASGSLHFGRPVVGLNSHLELSELDLQPETGQALRLSGRLDIAGDLEHYRGNFKLINRAEQPLDINLSGAFSGDQNQLQLSDLQGNWLDGIIRGSAQVAWQDGWHVSARLTGRDFNPCLLHEQLSGAINLALHAEVNGNEHGTTGQMVVQLQESTLHDQPLSGDLKLVLANQQLEIGALQLLGDGLRIQASGKLSERINLFWQIERLQQLFSDCRGQLDGAGWLRLTAEGVIAELSSQGQQLSYGQWQLENWQLEGNTLEDQQHWQLSLVGNELSNPQSQLGLKRLQLAVTGAVDQHQIDLTLNQADVSLHGSLAGGWSEQGWQGNLVSLVGTDPQLGRWQTQRAVPLLLSTERLQLGTMEVVNEGHGSLLLQGMFLPPSQQAKGHMAWQKLDLSLFKPWLIGWDLSGRSSGTIDVQMPEQKNLHARLVLQGKINNQTLNINVEQASFQADWDAQGLRSTLNLHLADGSELEGKLDSAEQVFIGVPQRGTVHLHGQNFSLTRLRPWLPPALNLDGQLDWQTAGQWQVGQPWIVTGDANIRDGRFFWQEDEETLNAELSTATIDWNWHSRLSGKIKLQLEQRGNIDARFDLPLAAALPLQFDQQESISGELTANLQELGLLSVLFPGRVQESRGQGKIDLQLSGIWQQPILHGDARLFNAAAFLPTLGIQVNDIDLHGSFNENRIELSTLHLVSAGGSLDGKGLVTLEKWRPKHYQLQLQGERFQLVNLPELQIRVTPDMTVNGDMTQYKVRGTLTVAELLANKRKKSAMAENSPDLVIVDAEQPAEQRKPLKHDIDLQLIFGNKVLLNSAGIDAKLAGRLRLQSNSRQEVVAFGEINVVKGKYASYGVSLDINRGNLLFNGGPLDQPTLDILALRKVGEVKAGVKVTGTPKRPIVQLYSEPSMVETDILSYIVLGKAMGAGGNQNSLLMTAAGALLSQGESAVLQEKLKNRLGLDVIDISAGDGDVSSSVITTGKYLNPNLYISLGYSLFTNSNEMKVRYSLNPDWELESNIGIESGVDLFYKIDIQ